MAGPFAENITLEEVRKSIEGRLEFREFVYEEKDVSIFSYTLVKADSFPDPNQALDDATRRLWQVNLFKRKIRRELRGLAFSRSSSQVISRRFHKFFNINEKEETNTENIQLGEDCVLLEASFFPFISPLLGVFGFFFPPQHR